MGGKVFFCFFTKQIKNNQQQWNRNDVVGRWQVNSGKECNSSKHVYWHRGTLQLLCMVGSPSFSNSPFILLHPALLALSIWCRHMTAFHHSLKPVPCRDCGSMPLKACSPTGHRREWCQLCVWFKTKPYWWLLW